MGNFHFEGHSSEPSAALFDLPGETSPLQLWGASSISRRAQATEIRSILRRSNHGSAPQATAQDHIGDAGPDPGAVAARGVAGGGGRLPHLDAIQQSFGRHDVTSVRAHVGGAAAQAASALEAEAYATGEDVAFAAPPDLHTAAHEAAHVVQQRAGVSLKGGMGRAGDVYERHADQVADAVVQGRSAEALLDAMPGGGGGGGGVQRREARGAKHPARVKYDSTPRFTHVDATATGDARYPEPARHELKPVTLDDVWPGELAVADGMPTPIDASDLRFIRYRGAIWQDQRGGGTTPMVLDQRTGSGGTEAAMLQGQEVDALHQWLAEHRTATAILWPIKSQFDVLADNGIVDTDFEVRNAEAIEQVLGDVANSGRTDRYPPSNDLDHSSQMLAAVGKVQEKSIDLAMHEVDIHQMEAKLGHLHGEADAIRAELKRHGIQKEMVAQATRKAELERQADTILKALDLATSFLSGGLTVWKGIADLTSADGGTDEGLQTSAKGGVDMIHTTGKGAIQAWLVPQLRQHRARINQLQADIRVQERRALIARLDGLLVATLEASKAATALRAVLQPQVEARSGALTGLGADAASALASMADVTGTADGPFNGRTSEGRGNIQRLFANMVILEKIERLAAPLAWPDLAGSIPLGGYLLAHDRVAMVNHMAKDAARFRWWRARLAGADSLLDALRRAIRMVQLNPRRR